jgi:hypothetical protein
MNKLVLASLTGIAVLAIATPVLAYQGNPEVQGPNYSPERHEAMEQAFEKGDYQGWLKLMEGKACRLKEVVNSQAKFEEFAKAHEAGAEELAQFRSGNGLNAQSGSRQGMRDGSGYGRNR